MIIIVNTAIDLSGGIVDYAIGDIKHLSVVYQSFVVKESDFSFSAILS